MSIALMSQVWRHSEQSGSALLLMLAIADYANDRCVAYPSIDSLALKTRQTSRNIQMLIGKIVKAGELEVEPNAGPHGTNVYRIVLKRRATAGNGVTGVNGGEKFSGVKKGGGGGEIQSLQFSPEPSGTVQLQNPQPICPPAGGPSLKDLRKLKKGKPSNPIAIRVAACIGRQPTTEWDEAEVKLFKGVGKRADFDNEVAMMERYYAKNRKRPENHCRTTLERLLKYWAGEVDRAKDWCEKHPLPAERKAPKLIPDTLPEEQLPPPDMESQRSFAINYEARLGRLPAGWKRDGEGELQHVGLNGANGCH